MTFSTSHMFGGASLELRRDGTFEYSSSSDVIGDECAAQGTWSNESHANGIEYVVLYVQKYSQGPGGTDNCTDVTHHRYWLIYRGGIMSVNHDWIPMKAPGNR